MFSLSLFLTIAPWLTGSVAFAHVHNSETCSSGQRLLLAGVGGILGYFLLAGLIQTSVWWEVNILSPYSVWALWISLLASAIALIYSIILSNFPSPSFTQGILLFLIAITLGSGFYLAIQQPIFAWDAISQEWGYPGYSARAWHLADQYMNASIIGDGIVHRHPPTNIYLLSWSGWVSHAYGGYGATLPWLLVNFSCVLVVTGYTLILLGSKACALLLGWMIATLPLLENHVILAGYHELIVTGVLLSSCSIIALGFRRQSARTITIGLAISLLAVLTKSTGPAYAAVIWTAALATAISRLPARLILVAGITTLLIVGLIWQLGFDFNLLGNSIGWDPKRGSIAFAGRNQILNPIDASELSSNLTHALLINSSFSLTALAILVAFPITSQLWRGRSLCSGCFFLLGATILGILLFTLTLATEYGSMHSSPSSDRQFSRSLIPFFAIAILGLSHLFATYSDSHENHR